MKQDGEFSKGYHMKLMWKYFQMTLKTNFQYKFDRLMTTFAVLIREAANVVVVLLMLYQVKEVRGWNLYELLFLYSFLFLSYSIFVFFFTGIRDFEEVIYSGQLDRFMVRPVGVMFQVIASKVDYTAAVGHGLIGIVLFVNTANKLDIAWNAANILYLLMCILGGAIIQAAVFMVTACFSFWTIKTTSIRNMLFFNSRRFAAYPITFYPKVIQVILKFVIPFAFVNFYPTQFFLQKDTLNGAEQAFLYLNPVVATVLFLIVYRIWRIGLKQYGSTGNALY